MRRRRTQAAWACRRVSASRSEPSRSEPSRSEPSRSELGAATGSSGDPLDASTGRRADNSGARAAPGALSGAQLTSVEADMTAEKEERATSTGAPRRAAEADDRKTTAERAGPRPAANGAPQGVAARSEPYLIAVRRPAGFLGAPPAQSIDAVVDYLGRQEGVEIVAQQ